MKLISEVVFDNQLILEKTESGDLFIEGIFMQANTKNRNGRIYPTKVLQNEVARYNAEFVATNRALGELNHPSSPSVNPERASHLITELGQKGNDFIGKAKILSTPQGEIVRGLIEGGVSLGVSSRGLGSLKEGTGRHRGVKVVQNDFKLMTVDVVSNPSAPDAFVEGIYESMDYMIRNGQVCEYEPRTSVTLSHQLAEATKRNVENSQRAALLVDLCNKLRYRD